MDTASLNTVLVAGASGGTGREVLRLSNSCQVTIRALTRSPDNERELSSIGADEIVVDDLVTSNDLSVAVADVDAVISAVGTAASAIRSGQPFVDGAGNRALVSTAADAGVDAFVMESAIGVGTEPVSPLASIFNAAISPIQEAKATAERAVRDASLSHTILRPGILTNGRRTDNVAAAHPGAKL